MMNLKETVEAVIFAAGESITYEEILNFLPGVNLEDIKAAVNELKVIYSGDRGIHLLTFKNKVQFSSNTAYGDIIAEILTPIKERALSRSLLEVMSIIAYRQPITRLDIEQIRGVNSEYSLMILAKMGLIYVAGKKDSVGRPSLYATTDEFLKKFELQSLDELPNTDSLQERIKLIDESYNQITDNLYRNVDLDESYNESVE